MNLRIILIISISFLVLGAKPYDIKKVTPAVKSAIENRQKRYEELNNLKAIQAVGENNNGYVEVLKSSEQAKVIARAENHDRKTIYQAIVTQNGLDEDGIDSIESAFANIHRENAIKGNSIQLPDDEWVQKGS